MYFIEFIFQGLLIDNLVAFDSKELSILKFKISWNLAEYHSCSQLIYALKKKKNHIRKSHKIFFLTNMCNLYANVFSLWEKFEGNIFRQFDVTNDSTT